jgi:PIN domain nuclease of toxin-antitoxin system
MICASISTDHALAESGTTVLFSAASIWEIAIKARLGRVDFAVRPEVVVRTALKTGFTEMPVRSAAATLVADLPLHHRDPFDRLLVAQAMNEPAHLLTADAQLRAYSELVMLVG